MIGPDEPPRSPETAQGGVPAPLALLRPLCPHCSEPWLRPTSLPGRYRCVYCLHRFELASVCPNCGEHSTIVRMAASEMLDCGHCRHSMLLAR